jgi:molybdenum cofactor cytidylyltransferase
MICAIVPAAGQSRRMGTAKQLLPWGSTTLLGHVVDQLCRSTVDQVYVVVGHEAKRIADALAGQPVRIVTNPDRDGDMLSSVRCALAELPPQCEAVLLALGDQPAITTELVDALIRAFASEGSTAGKGIVVPTYDAKRGHPLLFSARYREEILHQYDDLGLRGLLQAHADDVYELSVSNPAVLADIDNPADYAREVARITSRENRAPR